MTLAIWLVTGGLTGWVVSKVLRSNWNVMLSVAIGMAGAMLGGWFLSSLIAPSVIDHNTVRILGLLASLLGAALLLVLADLFRTGPADR